MVGKIAGVALIALGVRGAKVGSAANSGCVGRAVAGETALGTMYLVRSGADKRCSRSNVATQTILGRRGLILVDQHTCRVGMRMAREVVVGAVTGSAVAAAGWNGGDVLASRKRCQGWDGGHALVASEAVS